MLAIALVHGVVEEHELPPFDFAAAVADALPANNVRGTHPTHASVLSKAENAVKIEVLIARVPLRIGAEIVGRGDVIEVESELARLVGKRRRQFLDDGSAQELSILFSAAQGGGLDHR
jgi:hypothetical protein